MPGLVAERIDPSFLANALAGVPGGIVVVSGTNGKTTTTKLLAEILRAHGKRVFSNPTGSNFTRGVVSSMLPELPMSGRLHADVAVLELDEWHALQFARVVRPTHSLLLNVARDQLDRFAEIDTTAGLLATLAESTTQAVVLNRTTPSWPASPGASPRARRCATSALTRRSPTTCRRCTRPTSASWTTSPRRRPAQTTGCCTRRTRATSRCCSAKRPWVRSSSSNAAWPR